MGNNVKVKDKKWRSVAKAVSWRITGTVDTILVSWFITRKLHIALSIGFVEVFTKIALYYFHERAWERVNVGRAAVDYEI